MQPTILDCAVIGGGPAGLTAATYLGRFLHKAVVFDDGQSRMREIPRTRNTPGFPDGIGGEDLYERMLRQALTYRAEVVHERVEAIERHPQGFALTSQSGTRFARSVILATGVDVNHPDIADRSAAIARGIIRYCPICDGYECQGKRVAILAGSSASVEEALFLRTYSASVTVVHGGVEFSPDHERLAARNGIVVEPRPLRSLSIDGEQIVATFSDGAERFDVLYPCLGSKPRSGLGLPLGVEVSPSGGILVDSRQQTNIPMLYAAGDVLEGLDQIASACGQAAIAATTIHNHLRRARTAV